MRVELRERGVERRGLARAGRPGDQDDAVARVDRLREAFAHLLAHAEVVQAARAGLAVEDAEDEFFAEDRRGRGDAEVHFRPSGARAEAAVLRLAAFGDVDLREIFDGGHQADAAVVGERDPALHQSVDAEAHAVLRAGRLDVHVAGPVVQGGLEHGLGQFDAGGFGVARDGDGLVVLVEELEILLRRADDLRRRGPLPAQGNQEHQETERGQSAGEVEPPLLRRIVPDGGVRRRVGSRCGRRRPVGGGAGNSGWHDGGCSRGGNGRGGRGSGDWRGVRGERGGSWRRGRHPDAVDPVHRGKWQRQRAVLRADLDGRRVAPEDRDVGINRPVLHPDGRGGGRARRQEKQRQQEAGNAPVRKRHGSYFLLSAASGQALSPDKRRKLPFVSR